MAKPDGSEVAWMVKPIAEGAMGETEDPYGKTVVPSKNRICGVRSIY